MKVRATVSSSLFVCLKPLSLALVLLALLSGAVCKDAPSPDDSTPRPPAPKAEARLPQMPQHASDPLTLQAANQMLQGQGLLFIENRGQFHSRVKFLVKGNGANLWLTNDGIVFDFQRSKQSPDTTGEKREQSRSLALGRASIDPRQKSDPPPMERLVFKQKLVSASANPGIEARDPQPGIYNYFPTSDPDTWRTHVLAYKEVVYRDIWKGIDLKLFANGPNLEEEFVVHPGADASAVRLAYEGVQGLAVADDGSLQVATAFGDVVETSPRIYQEIAGNAVPLSGSFKVGAQNSYTFEVAKRDEQSDLIIDPTVIYSKTQRGKKAGQGSLLYSSFLGGSQYDIGNAIAVDNAGNAYVTGQTLSTDFPTTMGAFQTSGYGVFVTKVNALGSQLVYSTYLGLNARAFGIAADSSGEAYVSGGYAGAGSFPTTPNAYSSCGGPAFFTKLAPAGDALIYSTCFGGAYIALAVAVDATGNAYLTGQTAGSGLPITPGAFQSSQGPGARAFFTVFNPSASGAASLLYSTYFGGSVPAGGPNPPTDQGNGIAVDSYGMAYLTGFTTSIDFPVTSGAYMTVYPGAAGCSGGILYAVPCPSAFIAKFDPQASGASSLLYSTYLGGSNTAIGQGIAVDSLGNAYVGGLTGINELWGGCGQGCNQVPFPTTQGAYQSRQDSEDAFVTKLNAAGNNLIYSTLLGDGGGGASQVATAIALDASNDAYVTGWTNASNFSTTSNAFLPNDPSPAFRQGFVTQFNSTGTGLLYSSYLGGAAGDTNGDLGGIAVDQVGDAYVTGVTNAPDFPASPFAFQTGYAGNGDAFVTKFPLGAAGGLSISAIVPSNGGNSGQVTPTITGSGFHEGATAQLSCSQGNIQASNVSVNGYGLSGTFDLTGAPPGACDVVVTNPDNSSARLPHGFGIVQGGNSNLWTTVVGHSLGTDHPPSPFLVTVGNSGNVDAIGVVVSIYGIPSGATLTPLFTIVPTSPLPGQQPIDFSGAPFAPVVGQEQIPTLIIPLLPAGTSIPLEFNLGVNSLPPPPPLQPPPPPPSNPLPPLGGGEVINVTVVATALSDYCGLSGGNLVCRTQGNSRSLQSTSSCFLAALEGLVQNLSCWTCLADGLCAGLTYIEQEQEQSTNARVPGNFLQWVGQGILDCLSCTFPEIQALQIAASAVSLFLDGCISSANEGEGQIGIAVDPNDKDGPQGWNAPNWVQGSQSLSYSVYALNEPGAGAAAQQVAITDVIDPGLDPSTIALNGIVIGSLLVPLPPTFNPGAGQYQANTLIDYRPAESLIVYVTVSLNPATNTLSWQFASIDPTTGLPPTNQLIGVLPPGVQGAVLYSAAPKQSSGTGTQISNFAGVSFNGGTPQNTPTWSNTLDNTPPTSHVTALPGTELCTNFTVQWSGNDIGAGIGSYTIYVSDDGGSFTAWQTNTTSTSAVYNGQVGHSYGFYSIAQDLVGNIEPGKSTAEATTQVNKGTICGPIGPPTQLGGGR